MADFDFDCFDDLDPFAAELTDPIAILEQDIYHMLLESPGSNLDLPDRGIGLLDRLSGAFDRTLAAHIDAELQKDERIDVSQTTIEDLGGGVYRIHIRVQYDEEELELAFVGDATGVQREAA